MNDQSSPVVLIKRTPAEMLKPHNVLSSRCDSQVLDPETFSSLPNRTRPYLVFLNTSREINPDKNFLICFYKKGDLQVYKHF